MLSLAWFPASKITPNSLELGLMPVSAFSLWATYLTTSAARICKGWRQQMRGIAFKVSFLGCPISICHFKNIYSRIFGFASSSALEKC